MSGGYLWGKAHARRGIRVISASSDYPSEEDRANTHRSHCAEAWERTQTRVRSLLLVRRLPRPASQPIAPTNRADRCALGISWGSSHDESQGTPNSQPFDGKPKEEYGFRTTRKGREEERPS